MTKKEKKYLEDLEDCFEQLKSSYNSEQKEMNKLRAHIEVLAQACREHFIEIPDIDEPVPF